MPTYISSIGTAIPKHTTRQSEIGQFMSRFLKLSESEEKQLNILYRATGISQRNSVLPDFSSDPRQSTLFNPDKPTPGTAQRLKIYQNEAIVLAKEAINKAIQNANITAATITHLITVSCTGMYAPGLDIDLVNECQLNSTTERTCINFMGCYAAFNAIKTAYYITQTNPQAIVAIACVELCTLHFRGEKDEEAILSNALFSDGAAAVIISGKPLGMYSLQLTNFYNDLATQGIKEMSWDIGDAGFEMKLSQKVPDVIRSGIKTLVDKLMSKLGLDLRNVDFFAIHPGGKKILEVVESELNIPRIKNKFAHEVLRQYGNMSSPTVLFVLDKIWNELTPGDQNKNILSFAFGPGLTLESMSLTVHYEPKR